MTGVQTCALPISSEMEAERKRQVTQPGPDDQSRPQEKVWVSREDLEKMARERQGNLIQPAEGEGPVSGGMQPKQPWQGKGPQPGDPTDAVLGTGLGVTRGTAPVPGSNPVGPTISTGASVGSTGESGSLGLGSSTTTPTGSTGESGSPGSPSTTNPSTTK